MYEYMYICTYIQYGWAIWEAYSSNIKLCAQSNRGSRNPRKPGRVLDLWIIVGPKKAGLYVKSVESNFKILRINISVAFIHLN